MISVLFILLGAAVGAVVAWLLASRGQAELVRSRSDAEGRVKAAESSLQDARANAGVLQATLEGRVRAVESTLEEARANGSTLQVKLDGREKELGGLQQRLLEESEQKVKAQTELQNAKSSDDDAKLLRERLKGEGELRVEAETRLREAQANIAEQKILLEEAKKSMLDAFQALSAEALKSNNQAFITLARSQFETLQAQAKGDLDTRQKAIDGLVNPLKESLGRYELQILDMEKTRQKAYGTLDEQLRTLSEANMRLEQETRHLSSALSRPLKARGRWGELTLRRVVELAGMSEHCDFTEQETLATESGRQRPDMIVNLPGNRRIAVDSKVPLQAFLEAVNPEKSSDEQEDALKSHGELVRGHMNQLADRRYWEQLEGVDLVVMFLPGESFFSVALEQNPQLIEDGMQKNVILAIPATLIALLRSAAYFWQQEKITQNAREISALGRDLYDRLKTFAGHFQNLGQSIGRAVESYNKMVGSMESRVLVSGRKFKELGAATGDEIAEITPIDESPRALAAPELLATEDRVKD